METLFLKDDPLKLEERKRDIFSVDINIGLSWEDSVILE